ncbi:unnamed protein product [Prunus armeniaca]|uniref:Uncharacterized protein n=1 Tax=Prunus armeniaca TaxID=36596 RepID=A0A6J5VXI6_PRUAR|nr:unnamed protein product [Prunus armeniaca]
MAKGIQTSIGHTSNVTKDDVGGLEALKATMKAKLRPNISPFSAKCCIFRVPPLLRRHNPEAYGPDIVSIGPLHSRRHKKFQATENVKQWYLHNLLSRMNISLEIFIERIGKVLDQEKECFAVFEKRARDFYAEPLDHINQDDFIEMMILDGCFIMEFFRNFYDEERRDINDPIFNMDCMIQYLFHDLLLLENQLPWFVLERLYNLTRNYDEPDDTSLIVLMLKAFSSHPPLHHNSHSYLYGEAVVVVDDDNDDDDHDDGLLHILDLIRTSIVFPFKCQIDQSFENLEEQLIPTATALSEAGVKFRNGTAESIMNIEFKHGVFTIPQLAIGELTESIFRNLIAFEQCYHGRSPKITSYAVLMDNLICSSRDMKLLCENEVLGKWLSPEDGSQFFNKLYNDTLLRKFYYSELCFRVNTYYGKGWSKWLEILNPCILLVLTLLQTYYTVHQ